MPQDVTYFESDMSLLPGIHLPLRSMLVPTGDAAVLISPLGTDEESAVARQTRVMVVAPSLLHHKYIPRARAQLDVSELWGPPGFAAKKPDLGPVKTFDVHHWPHPTTLPYVVIGGAPLRNEVVFFHPPTRTIYTADLVFNLRTSTGLLSPLTFRAMGIHQRFAVNRMWKHWVKDPKAFRRSIDQILAWDFERIAMAHGDILASDGRERLVEALRERDLY